MAHVGYGVHVNEDGTLLERGTMLRFGMRAGMQSVDGKCQVRHLDFAEESHRGICGVSDRVVLGFRGLFPRLEEGFGSWVLFCAEGKLKTES